MFKPVLPPGMSNSDVESEQVESTYDMSPMQGMVEDIVDDARTQDVSFDDDDAMDIEQI